MSGAGYKFKSICKVPKAKDLVDIVLSATQRKTPTEIHPQFKISRVRGFYMRKVKYTQQSFHNRFTTILQDFPRLDEVHPFYGDLCNILYDRDHYKLALGQVSAVRSVIDNVAKDYVRLLKYADSHYKAKMLKRAALGRMSTATKKLGGSLTYLEEVRQHLGRLPSINPTTRTLILCGFPNVGKSSFINCISNANVEVQPYAFTTKSLYLGHFDYNYARWQVLDTPGILDQPLQNRNTIEMTAITALAHLQATIVYFLDVSENGGFSIKHQVDLFHSIRPLFRNKPLVVVYNKSDIRHPDDLDDSEKEAIATILNENQEKPPFIKISCLTKEGVTEAKNTACELLLNQRLASKANSKKLDGIQNRLTVATVKNKNSDRLPLITEEILNERIEKEKGNFNKNTETEKDLEEKFGGAGVYVSDWKKNYILDEPEWKYDVMPEIMDGRNITDFVDVDIEKKIKEMNRQHMQLMSTDKSELMRIESEWVKIQEQLTILRNRTKLKESEHKLKLPINSTPLGYKGRGERMLLSDVKQTLDGLGYDIGALSERMSETGSTMNPKLSTAIEDKSDADMVDWKNDTSIETDSKIEVRQKLRNILRGEVFKLPSGKIVIRRDHKSLVPSSIELSNNTLEGRWRAELANRKFLKKRNKLGKAGEADRFIPDLKPKHLYSGKRGIGKTSRR